MAAWQGKTGARIEPGDVLAVQFRNNDVAAGKRSHPTAVLATTPPVQGALVALDPHTGKLLAMVGGYDFRTSQFNRATQARRQIGSAIKPFIYAAAIDEGMTPLTIKWDAPVKFKTASGIWAPHNYKPEYLGPLTLRMALAKSINTVSAQLVAQMGVDKVVDMMRNLGITSPLPHSLSLSLGTADLGLEETAYALASLPAGGKLVQPLTVVRISRRRRADRWKQHAADPAPAQRLSPETAYIVTDMMKGVIEVGTGKKALALGRPAGRQDRHVDQLPRRLVLRLHARRAVRRLGRARRLQAGRPRRDRRPGGGAHLARLHAHGREGPAAARLPDAARRGPGPRQPRNRRAGRPRQAEEPPDPVQARHAAGSLPRRRRWLRRRAVLSAAAQSSICAPISTTRFGGSAKKSVAERALRDRNRNSTLRHSAMPLPLHR